MLLFCALVAAAKLWLVADDELVARANPLDQLRFLEMGQALANGQWLGPYGDRTLIREPGYGAWIAAVHVLGLPLHLATEVWLLSASALLCAALLRAGVSAGVAAASYALLALEPHSLEVNRDALPSGFYLATLLFAFAGLTGSVVAARTWIRLLLAVGAGLALGVLWVTRPEKALLCLPFAVIVAFDLLAQRPWQGRWRAPLRRTAAVAGATVCAMAVIALGVAVLNQHHYGVFATTGVAGPGYLAANRALLSIEQEHPRRFVPVPAEVRARAYRASPAFRELSSTLEGPSWARAVSCRIDDVCDDIGAGYFRWILREAAAAAGRMSSPAEGEAFFQRIADELGAACGSGALRCRRSRSAFLHPYPATYLPFLTTSAKRVFGVAFGRGNLREWDAPRDSPATAPSVRAFFDEVAHRRTAHTTNGQVSVRGHAEAGSDPIVDVSLHMTRQRLDSGIESGGAADRAPGRVPFGFAIEKVTRDLSAASPFLVLRHLSGSVTRVPLLPAVRAPVVRGDVTVTIDSFEEGGQEVPARRMLRTALWLWHPYVYAALFGLGAVAAVALLLPRSPGGLVEPELGVLLMLVAWVIARFALLIVIDASSFPARSSRYVYPSVALTGCALLLLLDLGLRRLRGPRQRG